MIIKHPISNDAFQSIKKNAARAGYTDHYPHLTAWTSALYDVELNGVHDAFYIKGPEEKITWFLLKISYE